MSGPAGLSLPADASRKAQQAFRAFLACIEQRFTGTWLVEFVDGVPQLCRRTETHRFSGT